jgi:hypothetical protein
VGTMDGGFTVPRIFIWIIILFDKAVKYGDGAKF